MSTLAGGQARFIGGDGEMANQINSLDWTASPLGSQQYWPNVLRSTLHLALNSPVPMFLFWGAEHICFYNDALIQTMSDQGKHPLAIGQPAKTIWSYLWDDIEPLLSAAIEGQGRGEYKDKHFRLYKNDRWENSFWNFSYTPVKDEDGVIKGVLAIVNETTGKVNEEKLQQLVDNAADFMSMAGMNLQLTYLNASGRNLVGLDASVDITTLNAKDFYSEQGFQRIKDVVIPGLSENNKWTGIISLRHFKTGEEIPCFANYITIKDVQTGENISRAATIRDLRPELDAEKELRESEMRFRNLVQQATVATAIYVGREMRIQWANDAMIKLWGKDKSVIGKTVREALPELEGQPFHQQLDDVFTTGIIYKGTEDAGHLVVDGTLQTFYFNFSYQPLRNSEGEVYGILNMALDITESVKIKRQLEESEKNFRSLIMQAPVGMTLLKGDDHVVEIANDEYLKLVGRERGGFVGKPIWEVVPEAKEQGFDVILKNVKDTGETFYGNEVPVMLIRNGLPETVFINFVYEPLFDENGKAHSILVVAIDITTLARARKQVELAEERVRLAIESAQLGSYEANLKTGEVVASARMYEIYDIEPTDRHLDFIAKIHPDDLHIRNTAHQTAAATGKLHYEVRTQKRDGSYTWVSASGQFYFNENGEPEKVIGIVRDITKEKEEEQELERRVRERTEELTKLNEELQQFMYVSSHDLKEPMRKVQMFTGLISDGAGSENAKLVEYSEKVKSSVQRMNTLINDLLNYSTLSNKEVVYEEIDLSSLLNHIQDDLELMIKEKNAIFDLESLPTIKGIRFQINQLFYNLLNNALKFSGQTGPSLIKIRCAQLADGERTEFPMLTQASYYKIEITDNGIGFDPQYSERIFGVFQRLHLRHQYSGTGIGLAICKKIVQNHKGHIYALSAEGKGTTVVIILPCPVD